MADDTTPAEAFALLDDETRIEILRVLVEAATPGYRAEPMSFSAVADAVGLGDTGHLSYHLGQLTGHFVEKVDGGYRPRYAAMKVVWAIRSGTFTGDPDREHEFEFEGTCHECGGDALRARYGNDWLSIDCAVCGEGLTANPFPPGGLTDRSDREVLAAFDSAVRHRISLATEGVCGECFGPATPTVVGDPPEEWGHEAVPVFECAHCGNWVTATFGLLALFDPRVASFYRDRGGDLTDRPYWTLPVALDGDHETVRSRDPWRVVVTDQRGSDRIEAVLDGDATVREVRVEPA